jgi:Ca-activated chloride channel family protein
VSWFAFSKFLDPWVLVLLPLVGVLFAFECFARAPGVMSASTGDILGRINAMVHRPGRALLRRLPALLRAAALTVLLVALARPVHGMRPRVEPRDVVDIMLCVDVSESMMAMDLTEGEQRVDRLTVTKEAVDQFVQSRKLERDDRFGMDRLGLVLYAGYAWTQTPLTLDYAILERDLAAAAIATGDREKEGTAIGSALGLAVSKLKDSEAESKVVILLTDGRNNKGSLDPVTAAQIAKDYGIRVYTIGAGAEGMVLVPQRTLFGTRLRRVRLPVDEETLKRIAEVAEGRFYRATDAEGLKQAYKEINELEKTEVEISGYYDYDEAFMPWAVLGGLLMGGSLVTRRMWFDPIP